MGKIEQFCHYYDTEDGDIHKVDIQPCKNCGVPVCSSCRFPSGFCEECEDIKDNEWALTDRAEEMELEYKRYKKGGLA